MHVDRRLLGWGLFLVIAGAIPLLVRSGTLSAELVGGWPALWPLLLIGWGLSLILRWTPGAFLGSAISVTIMGVMAGGLIATGFGDFRAFGACGTGDGGSSFENRTGTLTDSGRMSIEFNCGSLEVGTIDGSDWALRGTGPEGRGPDVTASLGEVRFRPADRDALNAFTDVASTWQIDVPRTPIIDLGITLNAGKGTLDLAGARLGNAHVTLNAGEIVMDLAEAESLSSVNGTVNAGAATIRLPADVGDANLTLNAGALALCVPAGSGIRVTWGGALASNNLDELGFVKVDEQHWTTPGFNASDPHLELLVSANAGAFELNPTTGGACDA